MFYIYLIGFAIIGFLLLRLPKFRKFAKIKNETDAFIVTLLWPLALVLILTLHFLWKEDEKD